MARENIGDFIRRCRDAGLREPEFSVSDGFVAVVRRKARAGGKGAAGQVAGQVEPWILAVLRACSEPRKSAEIQKVVGISHRETFQRNYLDRLLEEGWLERTIPEKPQSRLQKYRLTEKGLAFIRNLSKKRRRKKR